MKIKNLILILCGALLAAPLAYAQNSEPGGLDKAQLPNIIFFVMDDVGVDQMQLFGYGDPGVETRTPSYVNLGDAAYQQVLSSLSSDGPSGDRRTRLPNIEAIAAKGVNFTSAWAMPTCSPSRAAIFTGRLPARTGVVNPIQPFDLANSQVSPDALTLPKLLKTKGYVSGLIGKMHLSGNEQFPDNNPLHFEVYRKLGFDYFNGYLDAAPLSIDTQAGLNTVAVGTYSCGFIPNKTTDPSHGADSGTCFYADGTDELMSTSTYGTPGRACLEKGGILDSSLVPTSTNVEFTRHNGYYTANWVENLEDGVTTNVHLPDDETVDPGEYRGYRSILEANRAIAWINEKQGENNPWMATVGFSSAHTPWHNVPASIVPADSVNTDAAKCTVGLNQRDLRVLHQQMEEGLDRELGRILVETGIASGYDAEGTVIYDAASSNTLIVIVGDNGTFGPAVNAPFDPTRAKGFPYQTGVWVPLIAAGPMVQSPGREVNAMVNAVDLYKLFAELAGINADTVVPKAQRLDAQGMMSYLTKVKSPEIRATNLTQTGDNIRPPELSLYTPCVVGPPYNIVTLFFPRKDICLKNGGTWYGPDSNSLLEGVPAEGFVDGCAVNEFLVSKSQLPVLSGGLLKTAIRDTHYKLVEVVDPDCSTGNPPEIPRDTLTRTEFYRIDEVGPTPLLDTEANNLLKDGFTVDDLTKDEKKAYKNLAKRLDRWSDTVVESCPGDGNLDLVVDAKDIAGYYQFAAAGDYGTGSGNSSWYDFNHDGLTNQADLDIIYSHWGQRCQPKDYAAVK